MADAAKLTVFYDGACPLCAREIRFYKRRKGAEGVTRVDASRSPGQEVAPGLLKEQVLARFHVLNANGTIVSGGAAFAVLWAAMPGLRLVGTLFQIRPFSWVLNYAYLLFLKIRPRLQSIVSKR